MTGPMVPIKPMGILLGDHQDHQDSHHTNLLGQMATTTGLPNKCTCVDQDHLLRHLINGHRHGNANRYNVI